MASTVKRRWSGIQFGSKLASAFERLAIEDEEAYSDRYERIRFEVMYFTCYNVVLWYVMFTVWIVP